MIGYVLLIVIAISISVLVFAYLKLYLPSERPKCLSDINLIIAPECRAGEIEVHYSNRGLFSVDGALVRVGETGRLAKTLLNKDNFLFYDFDGPKELKPGASFIQIYPYIYTSNEDMLSELEIEPVLVIDKEVVLCNEAVVSRLVNCPATG